MEKLSSKEWEWAIEQYEAGISADRIYRQLCRSRPDFGISCHTFRKRLKPLVNWRSASERAVAMHRITYPHRTLKENHKRFFQVQRLIRNHHKELRMLTKELEELKQNIDLLSDLVVSTDRQVNA